MVPIEQEGGTRTLQVFPDFVMYVQKFIQKTLYLMRSLLHTDAFHGKSHFYAGRGLVSIQKLCCSRGGRRKKAVGGKNYPWAFSNSWSEVHFFASKSEASITRGRLSLAATARVGLSNFKKNLPDFISAQARLHLAQPQLLVCPGAQHPPRQPQHHPGANGSHGERHGCRQP